jgi:hypothetical protein
MTCAVSERLRCEALIYQGYVDGTTDAAGALSPKCRLP